MTYSHHFNNHVIDWYLWRALRNANGKLQALYWMAERGYRFSPEDWSRYDGELL